MRQEGFRLDPRVHFPIKTAGPGPTPERGCAITFSETPVFFLSSSGACICTSPLCSRFMAPWEGFIISQSPKPPFGLMRVQFAPLLYKQAPPGLSSISTPSTWHDAASSNCSKSALLCWRCPGLQYPSVCRGWPWMEGRAMHRELRVAIPLNPPDSPVCEP